MGIEVALLRRMKLSRSRHGHGFFDEVGAVLLHLAAPFDGVLQVPALVGVEHDLHVVAHGLAQRFHQLHVEVHAARAVARAVAQEPLLLDEAVFLELRGAFGRQRRIDGEPQAAAVDAAPACCVGPA